MPNARDGHQHQLLLTVFWDSHGPILEHYMEKSVIVTSVNYSNMLRNELRPSIRSKQRGRLTQCVLLLHDNACPHTAHLTINTILHLNWEVLKHPAYSPDLAPSDFHLFGPLKNTLKACPHSIAFTTYAMFAMHGKNSCLYGQHKGPHKTAYAMFAMLVM